MVVKPGEVFSKNGRYYRVRETPSECVGSDFAEWESRTEPVLTIRRQVVNYEWITDHTFVDSGRVFGRLLFVHEIDVLTFAMYQAMERKNEVAQLHH